MKKRKTQKSIRASKIEALKNKSSKKGFIYWLKYWWHDFLGAVKNLGQQSPAALVAILFGSFMCIAIGLNLVKLLFIPNCSFRTVRADTRAPY